MRTLIDLVEGQDPLAALRQRLRSFDIEVQGKVPASTWLIHFSPHADRIAQSGFTVGTPLDADWHYTSAKRGTAPGYNFAMPLDDYSLAEAASMDFIGRKAVLFRAPGLLTRHYDNFSQVIFWGASAARPFVVIEARDEEEWGEMHEWTWTVTQTDATAGDSFTGSFWDVISHVVD